MIIRKIIRKLMIQFKISILRDEFLQAHKKWVKDNGDATLRVNYPLDKEAVVFDLGGYRGDFSASVYKKYKCSIYVFEPVKVYYENIKERFKDNEKVKVFHFGLSDKDEILQISVSEAASSIYNQESNEKEVITLKSMTNFLTSHDIEKIDLLKINIEGGEFNVLPDLIKKGDILKITDLQIQFHTFVPNAINRRDEIRKNLSKTHQLTYDYWFIWENWTKK